MQIAAELGIQPSMLRNWRAVLNGEAPRSRTAVAVAPPSSSVASPADQAAEIARLRRELDRACTERDILEGHRHLLGDATMKFGFIDAHQGTWPVRALLRTGRLTIRVLRVALPP